MKLRELIDRQSVQGGRGHKAQYRHDQQIQPDTASEDNSIKIEGKSSTSCELYDSLKDRSCNTSRREVKAHRKHYSAHAHICRLKCNQLP